MNIAIDFDDTIVQRKPYDNTDGHFEFVSGAREALYALKRAGHLLLLWSARSSLHLRRDWRLNALWVARPDRFDQARIEKSYELNERRYQEMLRFVALELPDVFDAIDGGCSGKPSVDVFIDDKALLLGGAGVSWAEVAHAYGEPDVGTPEDAA